MAIKNRELKAGTVLTGRYHKVEHTCEVVEHDGKLCFRVDDGDVFNSISAAGSAVTGQACNGWAFWSELASDSQPAQTDAQKEAPAEATETGANEADVDKKNVCRRNPNQKGVPAGQVRWYCYACRTSFLLPAGQIPSGCPGHPVK